MTPKLTDRTRLLSNRDRATEPWLLDLCRDEIDHRLSMVNRAFTRPAIVSGLDFGLEKSLPSAVTVPDQDTLELGEQTHDLVIHALGLHWADDAVGQIIQCRRALTPDGLFLCCFLGGQTLQELRQALAQAEAELYGGLSPRIAPMIEVRDAGALLQRAGLALPVADVVTQRVSYQDIFAICRDLRAMGEGNALADRHAKPVSRRFFDRAQEIYSQSHSVDGRLIATFDIVVLTGWCPDASQPQPLRPGSATSRLADALDTQETKLND